MNFDPFPSGAEHSIVSIRQSRSVRPSKIRRLLYQATSLLFLEGVVGHKIVRVGDFDILTTGNPCFISTSTRTRVMHPRRPEILHKARCLKQTSMLRKLSSDVPVSI